MNFYEMKQQTSNWLESEILNFNSFYYSEIDTKVRKMGLNPADFKEKRLPKVLKDGFVYFIKSKKNGYIKIGWSTDPLLRLKTLQTGSGDILILIGCISGTRKLEGKVHKVMKRLKIHHEWYLPDKNLITYIKERDCRDEYGLN